MQLPRGTFREIKKNETIESILSELERTRFSGICNISSGEATGTLVFNRGKCILVKFQGKSGDAGWDELQKSLGVEVDAALSSLDEAQIQLALEFNKISKIVKGGKTSPQPQKPVHAEQRPAPVQPDRKTATAHLRPTVQPAAPPVKPSPKPAAPSPAPTHAVAPHKAPPAPEPRPQKPPAAQAIQQAEARPGSQIPPAHRASLQKTEKDAVTEEDTSASGQGNFEKDIDTFDTMDLENVTDKIRNDCKTMIKQLHLEHLMDR